MSTYSLGHLSDRDLLRDLAALVARDRATTAALLAHVAEVDDRKLYLPAAQPSMYSYCVHVLRLSEEAARKRIHAARAARQFPAIFPALADGRLHLSAVILLAPYLTPENASELLAAASHRTKFEIEQAIAARFPRPDAPCLMQAIAAPTVQTTLSGDERAPGRVGPSAAGRVEAADRHASVAPLSPQRFALQVTIGQSTHDKLHHAKALLSHQIPSGDMAEVLDRALDALIAQLEKRKFAATNRPRAGRQRSNAGGRYVPADVRRTVWERDGGQCTFVSDAGHRCPAHTFLEFDHIDEVARGGEATIELMRLRCRAHNQYAAESTFGTEFMSQKRHEARRARERAAAEQPSPERDVVPWLRQLGFRADEARRAAARCETIPDAPLEERVRFALSVLGPPHRRLENNLEMAT